VRASFCIYVLYLCFFLVCGELSAQSSAKGIESLKENARSAQEAFEAINASASLEARAKALAQKFIITDGHIDVPYRLNNFAEDISQRTEGGDFDYVRAKAGGLNAPFMSIYIPAEREPRGTATSLADSLIDMVEQIAHQHPDKFAVATSVTDVREHFRKGLISLPMGMENGAPIAGKLSNLHHFYQRGVRYITLTHSKSNHICDSSYDEERKWNGLSPFGEQLVAEMNRIGMMVDVSHISDSAFYDVLRLSKAPVIASHSSCRKFTPGFERNMSDQMIIDLAKKGGIICINFGSSFLDSSYANTWTVGNMAINAYLQKHNIPRNSPDHYRYYEQYRKTHPAGTVEDVVKHIDHVVQLVGVDYVGFGSDFDGVLALPKGLQDVSQYPNLIAALLKKGYSEEDIRKICGENFLRVWQAVEDVAKELAQ
jgi:membrane dipeptidase